MPRLHILSILVLCLVNFAAIRATTPVDRLEANHLHVANVFTDLASRLPVAVRNFEVPDLDIKVGIISIHATNLQFSHYGLPKIVYSLVQPDVIKGSISMNETKIIGPFDDRRETIVNTKTNSGTLVFEAPVTHVEFAVKVGGQHLGSDSFTCQAPGAKLDVQEMDKIDIAIIKPLLQLHVPKLFTTSMCELVERELLRMLNSRLY